MNKKRILRVCIFLLAGCVAVTSVSCQSLRKKFTRKKKKKKVNQFVPVLEPVDYARYVQSSKERYKYHYSLWVVWQKDLIRALNNKDKEKNLRYLVGRIKGQLEEMQNWLVDDKAKALAEVAVGYDEFKEDLDKIRGRGYLSIHKVNRVGKEVRMNFTPDLMEGHFVQAF